MATMLQTEVLVLGAGPGGYAAAFRAADLGRRVVLVETTGQLGGVCLHRGCIPSKALLHIASLLEQARLAKDIGIDFGEPVIDFDRLRAWKERLVAEMAKSIAQVAERREVALIAGRGHFVGAHQLQVVGTETTIIDFEQAIVATGSRPLVPDLFRIGDDRVVTSNEALQVATVPERLLVVGAGYIGLELGQVYRALGSEVTVVEMADRILSVADADLTQPLLAHVDDQFQAVHLATRVEGLRATMAGIRVDLAGKGVEAAAATAWPMVLVAVGRRPNADGIGLEKLGVAVDDHGFIRVDDQQRTTADHVFAIGDVAGEPMLAHTAAYAAKVAAEVACGATDANDARAVPAIVFTEPEVAWCGLTEMQAAAKGIAVSVARYPWSASGRARTVGAVHGLSKILAEPGSHRLLGVGHVGHGASELIAEAVLAIEMGATVEDLALSIHPHPTLSESLAVAAEIFLGRPTDLAPRRPADGAGEDHEEHST